MTERLTDLENKLIDQGEGWGMRQGVWDGHVQTAVFKMDNQGGGPKMAEKQDGETTFFPTNSSKKTFKAEQTPQNNF